MEAADLLLISFGDGRRAGPHANRKLASSQADRVDQG
jgi:hypothetical protein